MMLLPLLSACNNEEEPQQPQEKQEVTRCEITLPADGAEISLDEEGFQIRGEAAVNVGEIATVELMVGGVRISVVESVPFLYDYTFVGDEQPGELEIVLKVEGDGGAKAEDSIQVKLVAPEEPVVPDEQEIIASFTSPEPNSEWVSDAPLQIAATAEINRGEISEVLLMVGDQTIEEVNEIPFTYSYEAPESLPEGELLIQLSVKGDEGAASVLSVTVNHKRPAVEPGPGPEPEPGDGTMVDARDGKVYKTVEIGTQIWMAENLAYLPEVYPPTSANAAEDMEKRYYVLFYEGRDVEEAKATEEYAAYGVLYNWYAANDADNKEGASAEAVPSGVRGVCPEGWHLPSKAEWQLLEEYVASQIEGVKGDMWVDDWGEEHFTDDLKNVWSALAALEVWGSSLNADSYPDLENGPRDTFGFSAVPAGMCWQNGVFEYRDYETHFWTTDYQNYGGSCVTLSNMQYNIGYSKSGYNDRRGYSVRCVKD